MRVDSRSVVVGLALLCGVRGDSQSAATFTYVRVGAVADVTVKTAGGFALMGGGKDLDEAFRWLCERSGGGDFLILRAAGGDDYNPYVQGLCHQNSVATLILPSRTSAEAPAAAATIAKAEAIFIAGGDQSRYIDFWKGTPVQAAINDAVRRGVPIGGTSAGLAVMGEYVYSAQGDLPGDPNLSSKLALEDPFTRQITIVRGFINNPLLAGTITDSHFVTRDRMGRLLTMMARILEMQGGGSVRGLGVDERTSVLLGMDGHAAVVGVGGVYFLRAERRASMIEKGTPLSFGPVTAVKLTAGQSFNVKTWKGGADAYAYRVEAGVVRSTAERTGIY